jgi:excisionase family DNA binding protein
MDTQTLLERPRAYGVKAFCKAFGVSRSTVYNLIADGRLRSVRIAGRRLIPADAAEALLRDEAA